MVQFSKIFKQAYGYTKEHKFLWVFGLFLIVGNILFGWLSYTDTQFNFQNGWTVVLFALAFVFFILYFRFKAGLIIAIKAIVEKKETSFGKAYAFSRFFYSKILGIYLVLELGLLCIGLVLGTPIQYMFAQHYSSRGIILLILGLLIFVPLAVLALLINVLAPMFVVIYDLTIRESIERSLELLVKSWLQISVLGFVLFLIEVPALFLGAIVIGWRGGLVFTVGGVVVFLLVESLVAVFQQMVWVLVFLELIKPQKLEQEEPVVVPEGIS